MKNLTVMLGRTFVAAMFVVAAPAAADEPKLTPAEVLIKAGKDASEAGQWVDAIKFFEQSYAMEPQPRTAALLGRAQVLGGQELAGAENLELFLREEKQFPSGLKEAILELLARAKQKIVTVTLQVNQPGAELFVDGKRIEDKRLSWPIYLSAGTEHSFEVKKAGHIPWSRKSHFDAGKSIELIVSPLQPIVPGSDNPDELKQTRWTPTSKIALGVGAGFGALAVGTGIGALVSYFPARDAYGVATRCTEAKRPSCSSEINEYNELSRPLEGLTWAMTVSGAVGLGALGYALATRRTEGSKSARQVGLVVVPTAGGVMIAGVW